MAESETTMINNKDDNSNSSNNKALSIFPKLDLKIQLPSFPFLFPNKPNTKQQQQQQQQQDSVGAEKQVVEEEEISAPNFVSFPQSRPVPVPCIEVQAEESGGRTHNPIVIWQVYALGGYFVLKWLWARWNERKDRAAATKPPSDDNSQSPEDEHLSPLDADE